jgi:hypothetical protein
MAQSITGVKELVYREPCLRLSNLFSKEECVDILLAQQSLPKISSFLKMELS